MNVRTHGDMTMTDKIREDLHAQIRDQLPAIERYPERTADGKPARKIDAVSRATHDVFAKPRYWVRSRRHQNNREG